MSADIQHLAPDCDKAKAAAHTPGAELPVWHSTLPIQVNWTYAISEKDDYEAIIFCPGNLHRWEMARVSSPERQATEAYARLIASAPDLLEALKGLHDDIVSYVEVNKLHDADGKPAIHNHWMVRARSAINRAESGQ